jgi:uncharacterized protein (DUF433 family)
MMATVARCDVMQEPLITISKEVMSGTPVFYGTRVPFQALIDYLRGDHTIEEFLSDFPTVRREQVIRFLETSAASMVERADAHPA